MPFRCCKQIQLEEGNEGEQKIHLSTTLPGRILLHWGVEGGANYKGMPLWRDLISGYLADMFSLSQLCNCGVVALLSPLTNLNLLQVVGACLEVRCGLRGQSNTRTELCRLLGGMLHSALLHLATKPDSCRRAYMQSRIQSGLIVRHCL